VNQVYIPEHGIASSFVFELNDMEEVTGFLLHRGNRVRGLKFDRVYRN